MCTQRLSRNIGYRRRTASEDHQRLENNEKSTVNSCRTEGKCGIWDRKVLQMSTTKKLIQFKTHYEFTSQTITFAGKKVGSREAGGKGLPQFISMSTEIDFPRGGVSKVLHIDSKKRRSGAKRLFSTDHSTSKKKHKIDDECDISYEGVFRQKFTRDLLTQNLRGLAFVKYIGEVDLTLEYVEGIIMKLPATQIGKIFTKNLASTEATVTVPPSTKARGKNSMPTVTVCPNEVNSHLIPSLLLANSVLNGAIASIEEKGAVIDLGFSMSSANGFVRCDDLPPHLSLDKLRVGQVALFRVKERPSPSARVIALSGFVEMGCLGLEGLPSALESRHLTPGSIVEVEPEKVVSDGIFVGINGGLKAFIRKVHLPPRLRFDPSKIAKKFRACCIGSQPNTSVLMLNAHPEILALSRCEKRLLPSEFKIGSRINGRVFHVDKQQNVFFKLDDDNEKHLLTAKALRIHIDNAEENLSRFSIGSVHECRVIGFSIVERQLFVTTRSVDLRQSIVCAEEARPGMRITGRIKSLNAKGMKVAFGRGFFGFVTMVHALDRPAKHWQKRFQTGQKLSCRVLFFDANLGRLFLTAKQSLVKQSKAEKQIGGSVLITFYGRIAGILPPSKVALLSSDAIAIGMPIKVRVKSVNVEQAKMLLDLPSEDNGFIGEFLQKTPFRVYTARVLGQWPYGGTSSATTAELLLPGGSIGRLHASELSFSRSELTEGSLPMQNFLARNSGKTVNVKVICVSRSKSISGKGRELLLERHQSDRIVECTCIPDKVQEPRKKFSLIRYREEFSTGNIVPVFIVDTAKKEEEDTDQSHIIGEINPDFRAIIALDSKASATTNTEMEEAKPTNHLQLFDTGELRYGRVVSVNKTKKGRVLCLSLVNSKEFNDKEQSQSVSCQTKSKKKVKPTEEEKELEDGSIFEEPADEEEQENEEDKEHDTTEKMEEDANEPTTCFDLPEGPSLASVEEYEQFLIAHPNSCSGSIGFIRFCLTHEGLRMCRRYELGKDVAERALKMITFQNDSDLADVWRAYLNLEVALGTEESLQEVFKRACAASNAMQMHRYLIELLKKQTNAAGREEEIRELYESMVRRFRHHELEPWFEYGRHLLQQNDTEAFHRLLGRTLHCSEKKKHLTILKRFAQLENSFGDKEKAKTIEELIKNVKDEKKKVDVRMRSKMCRMPVGTGANLIPLGQRGEGAPVQRQTSGGPPGRGRSGGRGRGGRGRGGRRGGGRGGSRHGGGSPTTTASAVEKRRKTQLLEDIKKEFEHRGIEVGDPHLEAVVDPGHEGQRCRIVTNIYGVRMQQKTVYRYDVTISASAKVGKGKPKERAVEFTKRTKEDCVVVDRRDFCRIAFEHFFGLHPDVFGDDRFALYYDLQCILYTLHELDFGPGHEKERVFVLDRQYCTDIEHLNKFFKIQMLVRKVNKVIELADLSKLTNDMTQQDHSLSSFLELATSQHPLQTPEEHVIIGGGNTYLLNPSNHGFVPEDGPVLSKFNKYLAVGIHKSIRYVEGPQGRGNKKVGLIVESRKTPFHNTDGNLLEKVSSIVGPNNIVEDGRVRPNLIGSLNAQLKGLHVRVDYPKGRSRDVRLSGVSSASAANHKIDVQGEKVTVATYYLRKYEFTLEFPNAPLATALEKGQTNYYPMELCKLRDNQRAQLNQLSQREVADMIKASAVPPERLKRQIECSVAALNLHGSKYLETAGINITEKPLTVDARRLPLPTVLYADKEVKADRDEAKWNMNNFFLAPADVKVWAIYLITGGSRDEKYNFTAMDMDNFISSYLQMCRKHGMSIGAPSDQQRIEPDPGIVEDTIKECKKYKCDFVFFITSDAIKTLHEIMKACEQKYEIVTQDLKLSNAAEIARKGKPETVENIVAKSNEKLGGINYSVRVSNAEVQQLLAEGTLFIGLGVSHPGAMGNYERARGATPRDPSVIGYAANMKKDPFDFVGDYVFDEPRRDEKFSTLAEIATQCVTRYAEHRRDMPRRLVMFRNGTSEGQFGMSLQYEIPLIKHALKECGAHGCKLTVLVSQKTHNIRLFEEIPASAMNVVNLPGMKGPNWNIKPGTVLDSQVTHPEHSEFYLATHAAVQGTTRTPRYSVLLDESHMSLDHIQQMCNALAYCHKIINTPTSLPAPVYIALMYAKRGRDIYKVNRDTIQERRDDGQLDYEAISQRLCYAKTELRDQRVNA
uniref:Uncharacterized protein n=1 Tax=Globodera rostochiensis TaxID=31243 RepID=A0A914GQJ6_GLORO